MEACHEASVHIGCQKSIKTCPIKFINQILFDQVKYFTPQINKRVRLHKQYMCTIRKKE